MYQLIENNFNYYKKGVLDDFKKIDESQRKKIHSLNFRLGKNIIYNTELLRPELMTLKFNLWCVFNETKYNSENYIPRDGNATIIYKNNNKDLYSFLGFYKELNFLIRLDVFNEFEKSLFKREMRGPYALPIDLSNLLGIKKEKLVEILLSRNFQIIQTGENDQIVIKKQIKIQKEKNKTKKPLNKINTKKQPLFNNPFNELNKINAR